MHFGLFASPLRGGRRGCVFSRPSRLLARFAFALILFASLVMMAGCRDSDILTEWVIDIDAPTDETAEPIYRNVDSAAPDDLTSYVKADATQVSEQIHDLPSFGELPDDVQEAIRTQQAAESPYDREAASGSIDAESAEDDDRGSSKGDDAASADSDASTPGAEDIDNRDSSDADSPSPSDNPADSESSDSDPSPSSDPADSDDPDADDNPADDDESQTSDEADDDGDSDDGDDDEGDDGGSGDSDDGGDDEGDIKPPAPGSDTVDDDDDDDGGDGGPGQVIDSGEYDELPTGTQTIAACGQYALIAQMLGGSGTVVAADEEWLSTMSSSDAFPDEGIGDAVAVWSGDGTSSGSVDIGALIDAGPDTVLVGELTSGLNEADAERLADEGINVVVMPELGEMNTLDGDIVTNVRIVGELLKSKTNAQTGKSGSAMASEYVSLHDSALDDSRSKNGGNALILEWLGSDLNFLAQGPSGAGGNTWSSGDRIWLSYVDGWRPGASGDVFTSSTLGKEYVLDCSSGVGLRARISAAVSSSWGLYEYYLQAGGVEDSMRFGGYLGSNYAGYVWRNASGDNNVSWAVTVYDGLDLFEDMITGETFVPFYTVNGTRRADARLGDDDFPGFLARNEAVAEGIAKSAAAERGVYNPHNSRTGLGYGNITSVDASSLDVIVAPSGVAGDWIDGTVESFLLTPWVLHTTQPSKNFDYMKYIDSFYEGFYRCDASSTVQNLNNRITVTY